MLELTPTQQTAITSDGHNFCIGPAGTGKSTVLHRRLLDLLKDGEQAYTMLVLVSEPNHRQDFIDHIQAADLGPTSEPSIYTFSGIAREMISLFWPLIARPAGFDEAHHPPVFLGYDLAQLLMWRTIKPMMEAGSFSGLNLRPQQIVSQILDTLNRAALNNLSLHEAEARQVDAWSGSRDHLKHIKDVSAAAAQFRQYCLKRNVLDLSLVIQVFSSALIHRNEFQEYFHESADLHKHHRTCSEDTWVHRKYCRSSSHL